MVLYILQSAKNSCNSDFYGATTDEPECYEDVQLIARVRHSIPFITCHLSYLEILGKCKTKMSNFMNLQQIKDINKNHILEPKCTWASPVHDGDSARRSMQEYEYPEDFLRSPQEYPEFCHVNFPSYLQYLLH